MRHHFAGQDDRTGIDLVKTWVVGHRAAHGLEYGAAAQRNMFNLTASA